MAVFRKAIWDQLRNKTVEDLERALRKDGWLPEERRGATRGFRNPRRNRHQGRNRIVLHYHNKGNKSPKILKGLLEQAGSDEDDLKRLKLIK